MPATQRLRVGVIGCGGIAQMMHLPFLSARPDLFEISALADISPGLIQALGERYGVPPERQFTDFREMMALDIDAVVSLTGGSHAPSVLAAIEAGKHVLVEKPLCYTVREADEIEAAAKRKGVVVMVAYMKRYDPGYRIAQKLAQGMDDIRYIQVNTLHPSEPWYMNIHTILRFNDVPKAVIDPLIADEVALLNEAVGEGVDFPLRKIYGDVFLGSMVHDTNALRGLLGEPSGVQSTDIWAVDTAGPSITTELVYGERTRAVFTWTYLNDLRDYFEEIALMSPANRLRIQFPSPYLDHFPTPIVYQSMEDGAEVVRRYVASYDEAFQQEQLAFHACVTEGKPVLTTVADARRDIALLQQIFAAFQPQGLAGEAVRLGKGK